MPVGLPQSGQSIRTSGTVTESLIGPNLRLAADYSTASLPYSPVQVFAVIVQSEAVVARRPPARTTTFSIQGDMTEINRPEC
jgi:hypothetical protein